MITTITGPKRVDKLNLGTDVRVVWGVIVRYLTQPNSRVELVNGSLPSVLAAGVIPLPPEPPR